MKHRQMKNTENVGAQNIKEEDPRQFESQKETKEKLGKKKYWVVNKNFPNLMKNVCPINPWDYKNKSINNSCLQYHNKIKNTKYLISS